MRIVLQRVQAACVTVAGERVGQIDHGLLLLVAISKTDDEQAADYLNNKVLNLRVFSDEHGKMNHSVLDVCGGLLVVSQFTLYGDTRKGRRPSFDQAALPAVARHLFDTFVAKLKASPLRVETGRFGAEMQVELLNDGPVTFVLESPLP